MLSSICVVFHTEKEGVRELTARLISLMEKNSIEVRMFEEEAQKLSRPDLAKDINSCRKADMLVVLGGDGTILRAVGRLENPPPVLGVNLGKFGFLSAVSPDSAEAEFKKILQTGFETEKRYRLSYKIASELSGSGNRYRGKALNEIIISRLHQEPLLNITMQLIGPQDQSDLTFSGDGVLVSTATGSTAYSLSLGGPIISPESACLLFMPLAPHTLSQRPLILAPEYEIRISIDRQSLFCSDGHDHVEATDCQVHIKIDDPISVVKLESSRFFRLLQEKLDYCKTR